MNILISLQTSFKYMFLVFTGPPTKFEDFLHELNTSEDRITRVTALATVMIEASHFELEAIQKRSGEIVQMWAELKEVAKARQEVWSM